MKGAASEKQRFAINIAANIAAFVINLLIGFVMSPFIVNTIGKEAYGFVGLGNNFVTYISLATTTLNSFAGRYITIELHRNNLQQAKRYFSSVFISNLALTGILLIPCVLLVVFLQRVVHISDYLVLDVQVLWALLFANLFIGLISNVLACSTFAKNRLDLAATAKVASNLVWVVVLIALFAVCRPAVWIVGMGALAMALTELACNAVFKRRLLPELSVSRRDFDWKSVWNLFINGIWMAFNQLSGILLTGLDLLIANLLVSAMDMSYLSIAKTIPTYLQSFMLMICSTFTPMLTISYAHDDIEKIKRQLSYSTSVVGLLCVVPIMGFIVFGPDFYALWMGALTPPEVQKVHLLAVLTLLPMLVSVFTQPLVSINTVTSKVRLPALVTAGIGVASVGIVFLLLNTTNLGIFAVAGVSPIFLILWNLIFVPIYTASNLKLPWYTFYGRIGRGMLVSGIVLLLFYGIHFYFQASSWLQLIVLACVAGAVGEVLLLLLLFDKGQRDQLLQPVWQKLRRKKR